MKIQLPTLALVALLSVAACSDTPEEASCVPDPAGERCGGGDENCDGLIDEPGALGCIDYFHDADGDGVADDDRSRCLCAPEPPWTAPAPGTARCGELVCDDGNPCTAARCGPAEGCIFEPREGPCDDGSLCITDRQCVDGQCTGGREVECDDGNPCTEGICNPWEGCLFEPNAVACDDGDPCTRFDICTDGACVGDPIPGCGVPPACGDGRCNGDETCASCPADCSPLGFGVCAGTCDPVGAASGCAPGAVCVPTDDGGMPHPVAFGSGDGFCGGGCTSDAACGTGQRCVRTGSVRAGGVCRPECDLLDGQSCGVGLRCRQIDGFPVCVAPGCEGDGDAGPCAAAGGDCVTSAGGEALCLPGCSVSETDGLCELGCTLRSDPGLGEGICVRPDRACHPVRGPSCPDGSVCRHVGGAPIVGEAFFCAPQLGELALGDACVDTEDACGRGLLCDAGRCAMPCDPADEAGQCPSGLSCRPLQDGSPLGACAAVCGDGLCAPSESELTCPGDCPRSFEVVCGDGRCEAFETCWDCEADCGPCPECGDGVCGRFEDCQGCPEDCGACVCGDGRCDPGESCETCPGDCPDCVCGDGACSARETCATCPADCGACVCGDGQCNGYGEGCQSCPEDCGPCGICGDGICARDESCRRCPADCGPCEPVAGDGFCDPGETCEGSRGDCSCSVCGDGICAADEGCLDCPADCLHQGFGTCAGTCDPTAPSCAAGFACVPSEDGETTPRHLFALGDGGCARDCAADADCGEGARCAAVPALAGDEGERICVPAGRTCEPGAAGGCGASERCLASAGGGVCVEACATWLASACGGEPQRCRQGRGGPWGSGVCVGAESPCDPFEAGSCAAGETCAPVSTFPYVGGTFVCRPALGPIEEGGTCMAGPPSAAGCGPGLYCASDRVCRRPCLPGGAPCGGGGICRDEGPSLGVLPGTMGVCR